MKASVRIPLIILSLAIVFLFPVLLSSPSMLSEYGDILLEEAEESEYAEEGEEV